MKKTYKLFSLFLALTMLCTVFAMPVSAVTTTLTSDDDVSVDQHYYGDADELINAYGVMQLDTERPRLTYRIHCTNLRYEVKTYYLYAQCTVLYSDDSIDSSFQGGDVTFMGSQECILFEHLDLTSGKTITEIDLEYQIHNGNIMLWDGYIFPSFIPGINI